MSRKEVFLIGFVVVLAGLYAVCFTGLFKPKVIHIEHAARPLREAWTGNGQRIDPTGTQLNNISFSLHQDYRLTSVQVFRSADTNNDAHVLWHLVSKAGSEPVDTIAYGTDIPGMDSSISGTTAEPLEPGIEYRLVVEARSAKGADDFNIPARSAALR